MKQPKRDPEVLARMEMAFELFEASLEIMGQNIRRRHPELSEEEVEEKLGEWLHERPGAELGDAVGRPTRRFGLVP